MKAAACYQNDDGGIFQHFGHTEFFKVYEIDGGAVKSAQVIDSGSGGEGHESLASFLKGQEVRALICGGIGAGAVAALNEAEIEIYAGNRGSADDAAALLAEGRLARNSNANCRHHDGEHHHGGHGADSLDASGLTFKRI